MLKFGMPGARFYLTICFAGTVRYFHSLAGCDVEAFDEAIPTESSQGRMDGKMVKRDGEGRTTILDINQEDSSKSEDWKVCINPRSSLSVERGAILNTR